jgi:ADP-ribose pyrophosphatase YjhB (NUDIX family)
MENKKDVLIDKNIKDSEKEKIFKTLMAFPGSSFVDLWDKEIESNKFTYYLKTMEKNGLIEKKEGKYYLTIKGKSESTEISGETGKKEANPHVTLLLVAKKDNKYILYHRMKEPYYGFCGFPGAKVKRGEELINAAKRELKEETDLEGEGKIVCIQNIHTLNSGEMFHHMLQFVVLFENPVGELIKESREGIYEWATKEKILKQKNLFPDIPHVIDIVENKKFDLKEVKMHLGEGNSFKGFEHKSINI